MTHSTTNTERESAGSVDRVYHDIDITSLDSAGVETYDPGTELGLEDASEYGVTVAGQEDASLLIVWDHVAEQLEVRNASDATDVANNTDVGRVLLRVDGV
jgi:hypothetical protein